MNQETYEEAQQQLAEVSRVLREENLSAEELLKFEKLRTQLSGVLLSPWLPFGWGRRSIMFALLVVGAIGAFEISGYFLVACVLALFFSPHFVGEFTYAMGKLLSSK